MKEIETSAWVLGSLVAKDLSFSLTIQARDESLTN